MADYQLHVKSEAGEGVRCRIPPGVAGCATQANQTGPKRGLRGYGIPLPLAGDVAAI